jgi:hypothetical protein
MRKIIVVVSVLAVVCLLTAAWADARQTTGTSSSMSNQGYNVNSTSHQGNSANSKLNQGYNVSGSSKQVSSTSNSSNQGYNVNSSSKQGNSTSSTSNEGSSVSGSKSYSQSTTIGSKNAIQSVRTQWWNYFNSMSNSKPFTSSWYANHPGAWNTSSFSSSTGSSATWSSVSKWLGLDSKSTSSPVNYGGYTETMIFVTEDGASATAVETTVYGNNSEQKQQAKKAMELASNGSSVEKNAKWMPLGVYGLLTGNQTQSNLTLQLNVSQNGTIRGTYYDLLSDTTQTVKGSVDKQNQRAAWSIATNPSVVFETSLGNLTENAGPVFIHFGDKQTRKWTLVQMNSGTTGNSSNSTVD